MNAKKSCFYADSAVDFAAMCSTTYSYQYEHGCIENKIIEKFIFANFYFRGLQMIFVYNAKKNLGLNRPMKPLLRSQIKCLMVEISPTPLKISHLSLPAASL